ncbi:MAG: RecQ family ATP-dependent DNA helicase [Thermodesulfobacteriota bacterium]|nr:RecQ family ATP-dependent DNA helicase [Thermodesulfobacteriota bacterium]
MLENQLKRFFGFNSFKKGQKEVISRIMNRQSAAAIFPTGAGKSLCYQLPAMLLPHMTLLVSPLLSLMKDQLDFLLKHNIPAARLDSTLEKEEYNTTLEKARNGELKILMISVERFKNERFRLHLQKMNVSLLVIDEAHCISEWGHNFRPEYLKLPVYQREFEIRQVLLLTATATEQVISDMCDKFGVFRENIIATGFYRSNLFLQITPTVESEKQIRLLNRIREYPEAPTIVYVTLQKTSEDVGDFLSANGINASPYHAGMESEERETIQHKFMEGELACVVATIAFGMGIDKYDIRRVIHYDLPKSIENYSQEIGRSGRDGKKSLCEVLANKDNINVLENFVYGDTPEKKDIYNLIHKIQNHGSKVWETKLNTLSNELNIRLLPLKTLLVYLDMEGIISPKFTWFEKYSFKYHIESSDILGKFHGERKEFVAAVLAHCHTKKTWTYVDMRGILESYGANRQRIIMALEYFDEKGWIALQSRQAIEVYEIMTQDFNIGELTERMYRLFKTKELHEIQRIHNMVNFFESNSCLSKRLAEYFGEHLEKDHCGHCSFCKSGLVALQHTTELQPFSNFDFENLSTEFINTMSEHFSTANLAKFLCGISSPIFMKLKIKKLPHFGMLERYPFLAVKKWIIDAGGNLT